MARTLWLIGKESEGKPPSSGAGGTWGNGHAIGRGWSMGGGAGVGRKTTSLISMLTGCAVPMGQPWHLCQELLRETRAENDSTGGTG